MICFTFCHWIVQHIIRRSHLGSSSLGCIIAVAFTIACRYKPTYVHGRPLRRKYSAWIQLSVYSVGLVLVRTARICWSWWSRCSYWTGIGFFAWAIANASALPPSSNLRNMCVSPSNNVLSLAQRPAVQNILTSRMHHRWRGDRTGWLHGQPGVEEMGKRPASHRSLLRHEPKALQTADGKVPSRIFDAASMIWSSFFFDTFHFSYSRSHHQSTHVAKVYCFAASISVWLRGSPS